MKLCCFFPNLQRVNYKGIGGSDEFKKYIRLTKELQRVNVTDASRDEKVAFFINIYNALVIHANVSVGPPVNLWQRYKVRGTSQPLAEIQGKRNQSTSGRDTK
jgi:hypothetical protein